MKYVIRFIPIIIIMIVLIGGRETAEAKQTLTGQDALNFLRETGIYNQLPAEAKGGFSPVGREFFPTGQIGASDGYTDDLFGISVARDGDTVLIGVNQADVDGNIDQGVAYVFTAFGSNGWAQEAKLIADDGVADDQFGFAVALDSDTALVGAFQADNDGNSDQGAAYIFTRTGVFWNQTAKLMASGGSAGDEFGYAVALEGSIALIGAPSDDMNGSVDQGAGYVFSENGNSWNQTADLVSSDTAAGDKFGSAVALDGQTALVGAPLEDIGFDENQGAAYIFINNNGSWSQQARLVTGDGAEDDELGGAVALDGDTAVVGAHLADIGGNNNQGAAYIYTRSSGSWSQQDKLTADDGLGGDRLGRSVAVEGDTALIGAPRADIDGNGNQGAAYIFIREDDIWSQQSKLTDWLNGEAGDRFGRSVALDGDAALVGAIYGELAFGNPDRGTVYPFARSPVPWLPYGEAVASDGTAIGLFGVAVALDRGTALVGAPGTTVNGNYRQGAAYIFERSVNTWVQTARLTYVGGSAFDAFGISVALDGDTAMVGASGADFNGNNEVGEAHIFTFTGTIWRQTARLVATDGAENDWFGDSVALEGDTALVGAFGATVNGNVEQGAAYVFTGSDNNWSQQAKFTADDGAAGDWFGRAGALSGDTALVGATLDDVAGNIDQGSAYIFIRIEESWSQQAKLTATYGAANNYFGKGIALDGETALIGAIGLDVGNTERQGAAYIFRRNGSVWNQEARLIAAVGAKEDWFGDSVALAGNTALVGAPSGFPLANDGTGAAYLFTWDGSNWQQQTMFMAADGAAKDRFGNAVALEGNIVLLGATSVDVNGNQDQGKVYFYQRQPHENFLPAVIR